MERSVPANVVGIVVGLVNPGPEGAGTERPVGVVVSSVGGGPLLAPLCYHGQLRAAVLGVPTV